MVVVGCWGSVDMVRRGCCWWWGDRVEVEWLGIDLSVDEVFKWTSRDDDLMGLMELMEFNLKRICSSFFPSIAYRCLPRFPLLQPVPSNLIDDQSRIVSSRPIKRSSPRCSSLFPPLFVPIRHLCGGCSGSIDE